MARVLAAIASAVLLSTQFASAQVAAIRPPAVPLFVRSPYLSVWQPETNLYDTWPAFWTGAALPATGVATIDGRAYRFLGVARTPAEHLQQTAVTITPTQSRYAFKGAGVEIDATFLSPVEANDVRRLSLPFGYLFLSARSVDRRRHKVRVDIAFDAAWGTGSVAVAGNWRSQTLSDSTGRIDVASASRRTPNVLSEQDDFAAWGRTVVATRAGANASARRTAPQTFAVARTIDTADTSAKPWVVLVGEVRDPAISYLGVPQPALWKAYWPNWQAMTAFAFDDATSALERARQTDTAIDAAALRAGGPKYAALCALALRQAFGAVELIGTAQHPRMFLKEISSDGNVSTVDVLYPAFPVFLYENPRLLGMLLDPLLDYAEHGWPKPFSEHDIGASYPIANGHPDGKEEDMPVEESANMLLMAAAYAQRVDAATAHDFVHQHYAVFKQWADYEAVHGVDPEMQLTTDDFTGRIRASANLALKAVLSVGAMGVLAKIDGNDDDAGHYTGQMKQLMVRWQGLAQSRTGPHTVLAYGSDDTWSLKYNAFPDALLGLNAVPRTVLDNESAWYVKQRQRFGVPLDNRHTYTKLDWEFFVAAVTPNRHLRDALIDDAYDFANTSTNRTPLSDWYDAVSGQQVGFTARPVVGAIFAPLLLDDKR